MDLGLQGKVAMVAAASKGIGFAIAQGLIAEGCRVSICSRSEDSLHQALGRLGLRSFGTTCDVSNPAELEAWKDYTVSEIGEPDILVTNTGGPPAGALKEMTDAQWHSGIESTLLNIIRLVRLVSPGMADRGWGRIVHVTSLVAKEPNPVLPISSTLRSGIMALTRLQATELAISGVTVNGVLPGHTYTDRQLHLAEIRAEKEGIDPQEALKRQADAIPIGRIAEPTEIAAPAVFLCSRQASYITGVNLLVDGGVTKGLA